MEAMRFDYCVRYTKGCFILSPFFCLQKRTFHPMVTFSSGNRCVISITETRGAGGGMGGGIQQALIDSRATNMCDRTIGSSM